MLTFFSVVLAAIIFEYSNGFHDAANAIATVVSTRVLTPRKAIAMAAFFNLTGALLGGAVASTIGKGLVDTDVVTMPTVLCAVIAAFVWNIATWWFGLPSSSSHSLSGGRLAHHSHAGAPDGEIAAGARICGGNDRRDHHSGSQLLRHSAFHHARDLHFDHGRGRGETFQRHEMESCRANHLGLAFYPARQRPHWLRA